MITSSVVLCLKSQSLNPFKFVLVAGLVVAGVCACLFGLLDLLLDTKIYFILALVLRGIQAIGCAGYFTASYALLVESWNGSRLCMALGIYEMATGLGMISGPILGSALFEAGGFSLPFYSVGGLLLFTAILVFFLVENDSEREIISPYEIFGTFMIYDIC